MKKFKKRKKDVGAGVHGSPKKIVENIYKRVAEDGDPYKDNN